jgi:protein-tyrosine-phosphatase
MMGFRVGFSSFLGSTEAIYAVLVGLFYAALCVCTTLIFLDRRENTFCMPMHCGSSLLSGFTASYALALLLDQRPPSAAQAASAALIVLALGFLSPLHHFQRTVSKLSQALANAFRTLLRIPSAGGLTRPAIIDQARVEKPQRIFLFVCSGNTCRSPMAAAIANAEIAVRLEIPFAALETVNVRAMSAGISAREGAPLTPEAQEVLRSLKVAARPHAARNLTVRLADQAEMIFCMTSAHRQAVIEMIPSVAWKTFCLDSEADIDDPIGKGLSAYLSCAQSIRRLVRLRIDELSLAGGLRD